MGLPKSLRLRVVVRRQIIVQTRQRSVLKAAVALKTAQCGAFLRQPHLSQGTAQGPEQSRDEAQQRQRMQPGRQRRQQTEQGEDEKHPENTERGPEGRPDALYQQCKLRQPQAP